MMSEKITFSELIESIAEETNNSKQFTHDFLKDFVDVINGGLEKNGSVNIAGFGKFELRRMDERDGYNPQTEEKITIPAHNKVVFKPYKDLRELVNAPYAHLEPELIEKDDQNEDQNDEQKDADESEVQDDFIPMAPPTSHSPEQKREEESMEPESPHKPTFELDTDSEPSEATDNEAESSGDIVEFTPDEEFDTGDNEELNGSLDDVMPTNKEEHILKDEATQEGSPSAEEDIEHQNEAPFDLDENHSDEPSEQTNEHTSTPQDDPFAFETEEEDSKAQMPTLTTEGSARDRNSALPFYMAAAAVLLVVAAGAWYYSLSSSNNQTMQVSVSQTVADAPTKKTDQQIQNGAANQQQATISAQQQQPSNTNATAVDQSTPSNADITIEKGQTLWSIAEEKYGNPRLWPWIYGNNGSLNDPDLILAGNSLSVPLPSGPQNSLNASDSVGVAKGFLATYQWYKNDKSVKARNHLWAAKSYHTNILDITDLQIDKADLTYANRPH